VHKFDAELRVVEMADLELPVAMPRRGQDEARQSRPTFDHHAQGGGYPGAPFSWADVLRGVRQPEPQAPAAQLGAQAHHVQPQDYGRQASIGGVTGT
jgi:hypothetical protein